ncbi:MAG: arylesterase [Novosphingobium sp.]|nr:arylesterase [Novosphingobium sp.]
MKLYATRLLAPLFAVALLAGCGSEDAPAPAPTSAIDAPPDIPVMGQEVPIVAIGDSLFTGYGLDNGISYPAKLEAALRAKGINARIANAGVSGDTTAGGAQRLAFTLDSQQAKPDLVIISLGGNDMLRGLPPEQTRANLDAMLAELKQRGIRAVLLGMLAAPNLGKDYADAFNPIYPALAKKYDAALVPFFLQPLMDRPDLVQDDRIHPTEAGIEALVAETADKVAGALPK